MWASLWDPRCWGGPEPSTPSLWGSGQVCHPPDASVSSSVPWRRQQCRCSEVVGRKIHVYLESLKEWSGEQRKNIWKIHGWKFSKSDKNWTLTDDPWTPRNLKKTAPRLTVIKETIPQPERSWFFLREGKINRRSKNICVFVTLCLKELREDRNSHSGCWGWADEGWEDGGKETLYHVSFNLINILTDYIFQKITLKNPQTRDLCKQWKFSIFLSPASVPFPRGYHCAGSPRVSC